MIREINLDDNSEKEIDARSLQALGLRKVWLELVDPTDEELQEVAAKTGVPEHFLELPEADGLINLRLDDDLVVINFVMQQDVAATEEGYPIVIVFSKSFLVTVVKGADQRVIATTKARMSKIKVDPPAQVAYFIIDEIVSG